MAVEKAKSITIKEFKMWLQGVEEMQEEGWTPSTSQWKRIRDKIDQVSEDQVVVGSTGPVLYRGADNMIPRPGPSVVVPAHPSALEVAPQPRGPVGGAPVATEPGTAVKTPNIDTSRAKYQTPFA